MAVWRDLPKQGIDTMLLCDITGLSLKRMQRALSEARQNPRQGSLIAKYLTVENKLRMDELGISGFYTVSRTVRNYPRKIGGNLLGYVGEVSSPTFAIVHEYIGGRLPLYHFDMYRVDSWESLYSTGFFEYMETDAILAVEWSENLENALPDDLITVDIKRGANDNERIITISSRGEVKIEDIGD